MYQVGDYVRLADNHSHPLYYDGRVVQVANDAVCVVFLDGPRWLDANEVRPETFH